MIDTASLAILEVNLGKLDEPLARDLIQTLIDEVRSLQKVLELVEADCEVSVQKLKDEADDARLTLDVVINSEFIKAFETPYEISRKLDEVKDLLNGIANG